MDIQSKNLRNIVLLGHHGSGKTTLCESMLFESGAINRRGSIEAGNTASDFTNIEKDKGESLFASLMHVMWKGSKINIIDTPGLDDFIGEVVSAMKVTDTSMMVINAAQGVEVGTEILWDYVENFHSPALFVVNQIDHSKSDFETTLTQLQTRFGNKVIPFQYPLNQGENFNTIVDALRMIMYVFNPEGGKPEKVAIPESEIARAQLMHNAIVEAAAEEDETLMEHFFEQGNLNEEELAEGLTMALAKQDIFPVFCCSGEKNMGLGRIMGFLHDIAPSPNHRKPVALTDGNTLACDSNADTSVFIYKTMTEPRIGNVSYFKVYSGKLSVGDDLQNKQTESTERFNQIFVSEGKNRTSVNHLVAGDLGVTTKLKNSHTNNTLNPKGVDRAIAPISYPNSRIRVAVRPPSKADFEKLAKVLHVIHEEDPTLIVEHSKELKQTILYGQGQLHLDVLQYRIEKVYGLGIEFDDPRIPYRETITSGGEVHYRHKKQTGGAGQFAELQMRIDPWVPGMPDPDGLSVRKTETIDLPTGGQWAFYWCIVGGSIDGRFMNAIKKGITQKLEEGPLTGSACRDIRVCIFDGKMHPVDSNDMAFQLAASMAFKESFEKASPLLMEPVYHLEVLCDSNVTGDVMNDLQTRRGMIMGMGTEGHYQKIEAKVPLAEMNRYSTTLRSITQGKAKFKMDFDSYMQVTPDLQRKLIKKHSSSESDHG